MKRVNLTAAAAAAILVTLLLSYGACFGSGAPAASAQGAQAPVAGGKVLMVVIDRIGVDDLNAVDTPNIMKLIGSGAFALMNARVKYDLYGLGSYLVIGAGGRAIGGPDVGLAFNSGERLRTNGGSVAAGSIYDSRTGRRAPVGGVVNLYIEEMINKSDTPQASSKPGMLGQAMRDGSKKVSVVGNADSMIPVSPVDLTPVTPQLQQKLQQPAGVELAAPQPAPETPDNVYPLQTFIHREVAAITMDERGAVGSGDVSSALLSTYSAKNGTQTDFAALEHQVSSRMPAADLVVVDMGQTSRVDEQADFYTDAALKRARRTALRQSDASLGKMLASVNPQKDLVIVCTPTPTKKMILGGELVTPLVISGKGFSAGNQLHSPTTRRTGIVSSFDIAPTILQFEGLKVPSEMDGRAMTPAGTSPDIAGLQEFRDRAVSSFNARKAMVRVYSITLMSVVALFMLVMIIREDIIRKHPFFWSIALLALLAGPFMWLAVPAFGALAQVWIIVIAVCGSILIAALSLLIRNKEASDRSGLSEVLARPMLAISGVTLLLILLDPLLGSPLMTLSAFGSDVVLGDRYYGVGNLYMGFAIGAAVLFTCVALQWRDSGLLARLNLEKPWKRITFAAIILGATTLIIGLPKVGANVGGLIAALAVTLITLMKLEGKRLTLKRVAVIVVILIVCVGAVVFIDALMPGSASHAGRAVSKLQGNGISTVFSTISRKLATNWMLTWSSIWRLVIVFGFVVWLVLNWRLHFYRVFKEKYPYMYAGFVGLAVGLVVAWLFNDSGIEAAAAISVFLFVPHFVMLIPWNRKSADAAEAD